MPSSWKKYLEYDFKVSAEVYRAALTLDQIRKFRLPRDTDVKLSSTRAKRFIAEHGEDCWELDGVPEGILIREVSRAVESTLDMRVFNGAMKEEQESDVKLARLNSAERRLVNHNFKKIMRGGSPPRSRNKFSLPAQHPAAKREE